MAADNSNDDQTQSFVALTKGTMVSHYRIIEKIGAGGMGEVYLALDTKLNRKVALKFLPPHLCQDEDCRKRFAREAQAAAKLSHPNIVAIHEVSEFNGRPFFVMEHIEGLSLREVIKQGKLTIAQIITMIMQLCEGLQEAHEAGIIHRDIKPSNIIIDSKRRPKLLDFGLATIKGADKLTKTGSTLGTVGYMSPEQAEGKEVDQRSDIFSLGVVLYEMITGQRPFDRESDFATGKAIVTETAEPLARYKSGVTDDLQQIIDRALEKSLERRYQTASGMLSDLKRLITDTGKPIARNSGLWIVAAVIVLTAGYFFVNKFLDSGLSPEDGWTNSIAVLPLRDFSPDQDHEHFTDGMTEAIIGKLSGIEELKVISMSSVMRYKDENRDLKKIGHDLRVDHILEGSVQLEGDRIRVRTQLVNVAEDAHLWTETYDRRLESVFDIQDDISQALVSAMRVELHNKGSRSIFGRHTSNVEAFNAYVKGRFLWNKRTEAHIRLAIENFEKAIELNPNYALAYSGLADCWSVFQSSANVPGSITTTEIVQKSEAAARKALELDGHLAEAHASMGLVWENKNEYGKAEEEYVKAIGLNPGYYWAHYWYSDLLGEMARYSEKAREEEIAYQLNPTSIPLITSRADEKEMSLDFEQAEILYRRLIDISPGRADSYLALAQMLLKIGRDDEAINLCKQAVELDVEAYNSLIYSYDRIGNFDSAMWAADIYLEKGKDKFNAYDSKGDIFATYGLFDSALVYYAKAIELKPDFTRSTANMGIVYMFLEDYERADSLFRIVEKSPEKIWRSFGRFFSVQILSYQGQFKTALERFDQLRVESLNDFSDDFGPLWGSYWRAVIFHELLGMYDSAITEYENVINELEVTKDLPPNYFMLHMSRSGVGHCYAMLGYFDKAEKVVQLFKADFNKYGPSMNFYIWLLTGRIELARGNIDSAIASWGKVVQYYPDGQKWQILAQCYTRAGRLYDAIEVYERIVNRYEPISRGFFSSLLVLTHYELGIAYESVGRFDDAIKQYKTFLSIWKNADEGLPSIEDARTRLARLKGE